MTSLFRLRAAFLSLACLFPVAAIADDSPAANAWQLVSEGKFELPQDSNYPRLIGFNMAWAPELNQAVILPCFAKLEADLYTLDLKQTTWQRQAGIAPEGQVPDRWDSPQACCWLPGLKRILYLKEEWSYSKNKTPVSGWLIDPASRRWTPLEQDLSMGDRSADFNPSAGRDGMRLPLWGTLVYDPHNKEALACGGGAIWGRVGKEREQVSADDWIFDETAGRIRRLTTADAGKLTSARRWYPANAGAWTFSEATQQWQAIDQPLGEQPSGRILPGMAYDAGARKIVLFGGDDLARCLDDTWIYDCQTRSWSQAQTKQSPPPRAGQAMVYVPQLEGILLCGGYTGGWQGLSDAWLYRIADNQWTCLGEVRQTGEGRDAKREPAGLALPFPSYYCSGAYLPETGETLMLCYGSDRSAKQAPIYRLRLDPANLPNLAPQAVDPELAYHCKNYSSFPSLLPEEWTQGENAAGDPAAGRKEIAALPANTWVERKFPVPVPVRGWGQTAYDAATHTGFAWGGGHSAYPGAEVSEYNVLTNRWRSMAHPTNYNPVWLHGMVGGPPGVSLSGWGLLPTHARKSYAIDAPTGMFVNYKGDIYDPQRHTFLTNIGDCPGNYNVATQVSFVPTPHGVCGYSTGTLAKPDVAAGKWNVIAEGGPQHSEHHHLVYDSKRDRLVYFHRKGKEVWTFDLKSNAWNKEPAGGPSPPDWAGDSTYIPELDAVLLVIGGAKQEEETMYFYKVAENRWYTAPYVGEKVWRSNTGLNYSPHYDPELKTIVRFTPMGYKWIGVFLCRLDPATLKLEPMK